MTAKKAAQPKKADADTQHQATDTATDQPTTETSAASNAAAPNDAITTTDREPWADRLAKMDEGQIEELLRGTTLGERKRVEAKARLDKLRQG